MALQSLPWSVFPSLHSPSSGMSLTGMTIDAAGEKVAFILQATKTGTIRKVGFRVHTVTTAGDVDVRLEGVDLANGDPDGTLLHASAELAAFTISTTGWKTADFGVGNGAAVTIGDLIAVVIQDNASSAPDIAISVTSDQELWRNIYANLFTAAWAPNTNNTANVGLELSDGTYMPGMGYTAWASTAEPVYDQNDTPDHRGMIFQFPVPVRVVGAGGWFDLDGEANLKLFDSDGTTVLRTVAMDRDVRRATTAGPFLCWFDGPEILTKNTNYRIVLEATSTSNVKTHEFTVDSVAVMDVFEGGQNFHLTTSKTQTAEGDWTQTTTTRPYMGLIIDQFDDGVGGAGGLITHPGMAGGMRG